MKCKKIIISLTLLCLLLCAAVLPQAMAGETVPTLSLGSTEAEPGSEITLKLDISNFGRIYDSCQEKGDNTVDELFSGLQVKLYYDAAALAPVLSSDEAVKLSGEWASDFTKRSDSRGDYLYCTILCLEGDGASLSAVQQIADIGFKVNSDAKPGEYAIDAEIDTVVTGIKGEPADVGGEFRVLDGTVTVKGEESGSSDGSSGEPESSEPAESSVKPVSSDPEESSGEPDESSSDNDSEPDESDNLDADSSETSDVSDADGTGSENIPAVSDISESRTNNGTGTATGTNNSTANTPTGKPDNPKTGDFAGLAVLALATAAAGCALTKGERR